MICVVVSSKRIMHKQSLNHFLGVAHDVAKLLVRQFCSLEAPEVRNWGCAWCCEHYIYIYIYIVMTAHLWAAFLFRANVSCTNSRRGIFSRLRMMLRNHSCDSSIVWRAPHGQHWDIIIIIVLLSLIVTGAYLWSVLLFRATLSCTNDA